MCAIIKFSPKRVKLEKIFLFHAHNEPKWTYVIQRVTLHLLICRLWYGPIIYRTCDKKTASNPETPTRIGQYSTRSTQRSAKTGD